MMSLIIELEKEFNQQALLNRIRIKKINHNQMKYIVSPLVKKAFSICILLSLLSTGLKAQKEFDGIRGTRNWIGFSDAPNSLYHYIEDQADSYLDRRSAKIATIHTLPQWQQRQKWIRNTLMDMVGPFPAKTPLHAKVTRTLNKDDYHVEDIIYESQPGYYVTSSLFIPNSLKKGDKAPAIIYCSGHTYSGYSSPLYQHMILNFVKKGFIVFAFDPIGQGERLQYYNSQTGKSRFKWPSYEHSYPGAQAFITGSSLAKYFIWDGIRAVDYLLSRKEVDSDRIGIAGRSGGGTQSAYIAAFDKRIKAAAPGNYITDFKRLFQAMGPQDAEQNFTYGIARGIDMADLLLVRAPKPSLMVTTSVDMFPIQGSMETAKEVSKIYKAYGKESNFKMVTDDAAHASTKKNREATYAFFEKYLDNPGDTSDVETNPLEGEVLHSTSTGQLSTSIKGETTFSLNKKDAEKRMERLYAARKNMPGYLSKVISSAKELSGYQRPEEISQPMFVGRIQREGYVIEKYLLKGEGNYMIPYLLLKPETSARKALIYLNPLGKSADSDVGGDMEFFVKSGFTVLAPDMVGTGELGPGDFHGDSYIDSVSYNLWFAAILIKRSLVGIQAADVVRLAMLLKKDNDIKEIYGLAKKEMSPVLLHAAAFDKDIRKVALIGPYSSYRSIVMNRNYDPHFIQSTVAGSIGIYDLPDLAVSLAPRKLLIAGTTNGAGSSGKASDIDQDLSVIKAAYNKTTKGQLQIVPATMIEKLSDNLQTWMAD